MTGDGWVTVGWAAGALAVMLAPLLALEAGVMAAWMVGELRAERATRRRLEKAEKGKPGAHRAGVSDAEIRRRS